MNASHRWERLALAVVGVFTCLTVIAFSGGRLSAAVSSSFVTREGRGLFLDGQPFVFTGFNIYNANSNGWCRTSYTNPMIQDAFAEIGSGNAVVRSWFDQTLATTGPTSATSADATRTWAKFDQTINAAHAAGIHLIVTLTGQWLDCGAQVPGHNGYKPASWYTAGYLEPDAELAAYYGSVYVSYRDWVAEIVGRYKNEPAILAWQLINEAEVNESQGGTCGENAAIMLHDWAEDVSGLIRSIDSNHLISLGTIGGGQCGTNGLDYRTAHNVSSIDLCEFHDYSTVAMPGGTNGLEARLALCNGLNKPLFVGESGVARTYGDDLVDRAALFAQKITNQIAAGVVGELVWQYAQNDAFPEQYDVYAGSGDPTITIVRDGGISETPLPSASEFLPTPTPTVAPTPAKASQTISFTNPGTHTVLDPPVALSASASSGLPVSLRSETPSVCTVSSRRAILHTVGSCRLAADQAGNASFRPAPTVTRTFSVTRAPQSISFPSIGGKTLAAKPFPLAPIASSGLPVTLKSNSATVCTVQALTVTLVGAGTCSLTANQGGDSTYLPAPGVTRTFAVSKANQTITFAAIPNKSLAMSPFTIAVAPSSTSGLPVSVSSLTPTVCTVRGYEVTLLKAGACTLVARQGGNAHYAAAAAVARTFTVVLARQVITFPSPGTQSTNVPRVKLSAISSAGIKVTLTSATTAVCTVSGDLVKVLRTGSCSIDASANGTSYWAPATLRRSFSVIASPLPFLRVVGTSLRLGTASFMFDGAAVYHASSGGNQSPAQAIAMASQAGLNSIRLTDLFNQDGTHADAPYDESSWRRIDELIARARGANMKVVLDLSSYRNFLVNGAKAANGWITACKPRDQGGNPDLIDYRKLDPYRDVPALKNGWHAFLTFVINRMNTFTNVRYKSDAAIAVISIAGEPQGFKTEECGKAATDAAELTQFFARELADLAALDPTHLRSSGGLVGAHDVNYIGVNGRDIFGIADNTVPSLHTYPPVDGNHPDATPVDDQTPILGSYARDQLHKPWFTEEFGWPQWVGDANRADDFAFVYEEQSTYGSSGALFWSLGTETGGGSHDVGPQTPKTWKKVQQH